jgi:hypothetical protein
MTVPTTRPSMESNEIEAHVRSLVERSPLPIPEHVIERRMEVRQDLTRYETVKLIQEWMATREAQDAYIVGQMEHDVFPDRMGCSHAVC